MKGEFFTLSFSLYLISSHFCTLLLYVLSLPAVFLGVDTMLGFVGFFLPVTGKFDLIYLGMAWQQRGVLDYMVIWVD